VSLGGLSRNAMLAAGLETMTANDRKQHESEMAKFPQRMIYEPFDMSETAFDHASQTDLFSGLVHSRRHASLATSRS